MEQSPLELYETAYKLHYIDNRISDALLYYQKLIEVFPDSNECGYASIQIQKIKAENLAREIKKAGKILHPVSMIAFILGILSLLLSGSFGFLLNKKLNLENKRSSMALNALSKMYRGEDEEALKILTELKIISSNDITPFELTADIYKKRRNFKASRDEYTLFYKLNSALKPTDSANRTMRNLDDMINMIESRKNSTKKVEEPVSPPTSPTVDPSAIKKKQAEQGKKPANSSLVTKDSISYF